MLINNIHQWSFITFCSFLFLNRRRRRCFLLF